MIRRLAFLLLLPLATSLPAQQRAPRRPHLPAEADTNDAAIYFQLGLDRLDHDAATAEAAFYWASRLDPMSPQALYALGVARLLRDPARLVKWYQRDEHILASVQVRGIDSLRYRAEMQDPFLHRGLDEVVLFTFAKAATHSEEWFGTSTSGGASTISSDRTSNNAGLVGATESFLERSDQYGRGLLYYSQGDLRNALQYLALTLRNHESDWVWAERARVWAELRQLDSAAYAMRSALRLRRGPADDPGRPMYESTAAWQFALGRILEDKRDTASARTAYQAAIAADPAYYPAALRLGALAALGRDTAATVAAFQSVLARADLQFFAFAVSATVLSRMGRRDLAVAALRRGTEREPLASAGWLMLARALETVSDTMGAAASYDRYLALAPRGDAARTNATQAVARLRHTTP